MTLDQQDLLFEICAPRALAGEPSREVGVTRADDALLDKVEHILDCAVDPGPFGAQCFHMRLSFADGGGAVVEQVHEKLLQSFRAQQSFGHGIDDDGLKLLVANACALGDGVAATKPARTAVIPIAPTLAGRDSKRVTTFRVTAFRNAREHGRAGDDTSRCNVHRVARDTGLDFEPLGLRNNDRCVDRMPVFFWAFDTVADVIHAVEMLAAIGRAVEDVLDVRHVPFAPAQRGAARVQVTDDLLIAHRPSANADPLHAEYLLDHQRFGSFDRKALLGLGAAHLGDLGDIAERWLSTVPEPALGVSPYCVGGGFSGLARLIFVEIGQDRADQIAFGVVADLLRGCDQPHTRSLRLTPVMFEQIMVSEESRKAVDTDLEDTAACAKRCSNSA